MIMISSFSKPTNVRVPAELRVLMNNYFTRARSSLHLTSICRRRLAVHSSYWSQRLILNRPMLLFHAPSTGLSTRRFQVIGHQKSVSFYIINLFRSRQCTSASSSWIRCCFSDISLLLDITEPRSDSSCSNQLRSVLHEHLPHDMLQRSYNLDRVSGWLRNVWILH